MAVYLPKDFDPEKHERKFKSKIGREDLKEGVNLLGHDGNTYYFAKLRKKTTGGTAGAKVIRCWRCHQRADGSVDCFQVTCPWE
jgi:hypothetical protein